MGNAFGLADDLARAEAEYDEALRLNPGSAELLTMYAGWAVSFGKPERGAEAADKAIRLNPRYLPWQARPFTHAYFMVGRYEDALRMLERLSPDQWNQGVLVRRVGVFAGLGRMDEARAATADALKRFPDLTIEGLVNGPGWSDFERQRFIETLRAAGFPACARPETLARFAKPVRLPECAKS
jgi:tetratricopeptide (TPR) repeat protein